jgi:hypothetical protein
MGIREFSTPEDLRRFADLPRRVYQNNPAYIAADSEHSLEQLLHTAPHHHLQCFGYEADGELVGTLAAVIDDNFNRFWNDKVGHLVFFEALPGRDDAVAELFAAACGWLKKGGCATARCSFHYLWQLPLLIDAYDQPATFLHRYNPPYYHSYVKNSGFRTDRGALEFRVTFNEELASRYRQLVDRALASGIELRPWDLDQVDREAARFCQTHNDAFAEHWGAPQFTAEESKGFISGLRDVLPPGFLWFAESRGTLAGLVFSLPDLHQPMRGQPLDHGILLDIAVAKPFRGRGVNLALCARSFLGMIEQGYKSASYTLVLDDNLPSRRTAEKLGCRIARNYVIYDRCL